MRKGTAPETTTLGSDDSMDSRVLVRWRQRHWMRLETKIQRSVRSIFSCMTPYHENSVFRPFYLALNTPGVNLTMILLSSFCSGSHHITFFIPNTVSLQLSFRCVLFRCVFFLKMKRMEQRWCDPKFLLPQPLTFAFR